jgi:hypothetical protein
MRYVKIVTISDFTELKFYIELSDDNMENRKIELANGGILGFANIEISFHGTASADTPLLKDQEINSDTDSEVYDISKEEFELIWAKVVDGASLIN